MKKKLYNAPEVKFHKLRIKTAMLAESGGQVNDDDPIEAKGFSRFSFDEDDDY